MRSMLSEPVPAFSPAIPPQRAVPFLPVRSCSLWRNLLPGPPLSRTGSIWVLLEKNPPQAFLRPGWHPRLWGERAIPLLIKKELYAYKIRSIRLAEQERRCRL